MSHITASQSMLPKWFDSPERLSLRPNQNIEDWLTKPYVLSRYLKKVTSDFEVDVLGQGFGNPTDDEYAKICQHSPDWLRSSYIRRVFLKEGDRPIIFGRVVIPNETYERHFARINQTGNNPFGESVLYSHPNFNRSTFEYAVFMPHHQQLYLSQNDLKMNQPLWGRRSLFELSGFPILVTELFLCELPLFPENMEDDTTLSPL